MRSPLMEEPFVAAPSGIPRREQLLHVSWIFLFASLVSEGG